MNLLMKLLMILALQSAGQFQGVATLFPCLPADPDYPCSGFPVAVSQIAKDPRITSAHPTHPCPPDQQNHGKSLYSCHFLIHSVAGSIFLQARKCFAETTVPLDGHIMQSSPVAFRFAYLFCSVLQPGTLPGFSSGHFHGTH